MSQRALLWVAVSSVSQADEDKNSLPTQEAELRAKAAQMGWQVIDVLHVPGHSRAYVDIHECAADMRQAGIDAFDRLFEHWRRRSFDVLACRDGDRFGRKQTIFSYVVERTIDNGARLYTLSDGWIDERNFRMAISMGSYKAASEIDALVKRYQFGIRGRVKRGLPPSRTPATHLLIRDDGGRAERLIVDESKRRLFDDILDLVCRERVVIRGIEKRLAERGHPAFGGRMVDSWLRNPYTWGHSAVRFIPINGNRHWQWVYDPAVPVPEGVEIWRNTHPAVWTGDQAAEMIAELDRRHAVYGMSRRGYGTSRYSGLLRCADCGGRASYHRSPRGLRYLRCNVNCRPGELREAVVDAFVSQLLDALADGQDLGDLLRDPPDTSAARARQLQDEIDAVTAQTRTLIRKQASAPAALYSLYDDELSALAARLNALQREQARIQPPVDRASPDQVVGTLRSRGSAWFWALPEIEQNAALHTLLGARRILITARAVAGLGMPFSP